MNIVLGKKTPHLKGKSYFELQELHEIIEALELSEYIEIPELISIASNYSQSVKDTKPPVACILKQSNAIVFYIREDLSISLQTYSKEALYKSCNLIDVQNLDSTFNKEKLNTLLTLFLEDVHDIDIDVYIILFKKNYQPPFHPEMESVQLSQALIKFYNISESLGLKDIQTRCLEKLSSLTSLEISPGHTSYLFKNELTSDSLSTTIIHADQRIITTVLRDLIDTPNLRKVEKITSLILKSIKKRGSFL